MNYLTQYYKNICENLQAKIEIIEANLRSASEIQQLGSEEYRKALDKKKMELGRDLTMDEISDVGQTTVVPYTTRALKREALIAKATEQLPSVAQTGDVETATQYADVMGDISKRNISGKVAGFANLGPDSARTLQQSVENIAQIGRDMRNRGMQTSVPADIASLRKFIQMGQGKYEAPYPQPTEKPTDSTPNFFDGPDMGKMGSASEVVAAQRRNQYKGSIKENKKSQAHFKNIFNESADKSREMKDGLLTDVNYSEITPETIHTIHPDHLYQHLKDLTGIIEDPHDERDDSEEWAKHDMIDAHLEKMNYFSKF